MLNSDSERIRARGGLNSFNFLRSSLSESETLFFVCSWSYRYVSSIFHIRQPQVGISCALKKMKHYIYVYIFRTIILVRRAVLRPRASLFDVALLSYEDDLCRARMMTLNSVLPPATLNESHPCAEAGRCILIFLLKNDHC